MTVDLTGQTFNNLKVIKYDIKKSIEKRQNFWICKCSCGDESFHVVSSTNLRLNITKGCPLCKNERIGESSKSHGMKYSKIYRVWMSMRQRCSLKQTNGYNSYGGRGIKVCKEWDEFENFHKWSKNNGYREGLSIDRIDVNGDYYPENCRWIPLHRQMRNMRNTIYVTYQGKEYVLLDLLEYLGREDDYDKIRSRISSGWSMDESLKIPHGVKKHYYYFAEGLREEFDGKKKGYRIDKSDFTKKYIDKEYTSKFASYANSKYIKEIIEQLNIQNNKFYLEKI